VKEEFEAIKNFLDNRYSKEDYLTVISQFEHDDEFEKLKDYLERYWKEGKENIPPDENYQALYLKIQQQILKQELQHRGSRNRKLVHYLSRIAAILIVPVFLAGLYFYAQWRKIDSQKEVYAEIYCPPGTRSRFNLPDGSSGWLNSDSYLKYPVWFINNREVELNGEAFFDVVKKKYSPFRVHTGGIQVEALGTHFNVMAYPDCERVEVSLEEGSVKVTKPETNLNEILIPDQRLVFSKSENKVAINSGDTDYFTSWKDGFLVFRNVPMREVAARLSRWYNSEIIIEDDKLKEVPFRATFKNESLERVLSLLAISTPISYQLIESKPLKDGTYEKQKVRIMAKN
jgi:ferric-dicitrate binding protein FerR (iron transport regulator)